MLPKTKPNVVRKSDRRECAQNLRCPCRPTVPPVLVPGPTLLASSAPDALQDSVAARKIRQLLSGLPNRVLLKGGLIPILRYQFAFNE